MWWAFVLLAWVGCNEHLSERACFADEKCHWNSYSRQCGDLPWECGSRLAMADCVKDGHCLWTEDHTCQWRSRSALDKLCNQTYPTQHNMELAIECDKDATCEFDANAQLCVESRFSACAAAGERCNTTLGCHWERGRCRTWGRDGHTPCWLFDQQPQFCQDACTYQDRSRECNANSLYPSNGHRFFCRYDPDEPGAPFPTNLTRQQELCESESKREWCHLNKDPRALYPCDTRADAVCHRTHGPNLCQSYSYCRFETSKGCRSAMVVTVNTTSAATVTLRFPERRWEVAVASTVFVLGFLCVIMLCVWMAGRDVRHETYKPLPLPQNVTSTRSRMHRAQEITVNRGRKRV